MHLSSVLHHIQNMLNTIISHYKYTATCLILSASSRACPVVLQVLDWQRCFTIPNLPWHSFLLTDLKVVCQKQDQFEVIYQHDNMISSGLHQSKHHSSSLPVLLGLPALALHIAECSPCISRSCKAGVTWGDPVTPGHWGDLELEWPGSWPVGQEQGCAKGQEKKRKQTSCLQV